MNTLTYLAVADPMVDKKFTDVGEALGYSLPKALFGFAIVFAVLILIWGVISLMRVFFYTIPTAKKNASAKQVKNANSVKNSVVSEAPDSFSGVVAVQDSNASIAAAIIAAVSAFRASNGESVNGFRVVSFKKRK